MKKRVLFLSVFVALTSFIIYNCSSTKGYSTYSNKTICSDYSRVPISQLPVALVHDMVKGYRDNQLTEINNGLTINDAKAISFDLETLKQFIYHIEAITKEKDSTISTDDLGIRLYYAAYPKKEDWTNDEKRYEGALDDFLGDSETEQYERLHTLVMIPTMVRENVEFDFNPNDDRTYKQGLQSIVDDQGAGYYSNPDNTIMSLSLISRSSRSSSSSSLGSSSTALNHGSLFPPKSDTGLGF